MIQLDGARLVARMPEVVGAAELDATLRAVICASDQIEDLAIDLSAFARFSFLAETRLLSVVASARAKGLSVTLTTGGKQESVDQIDVAKYRRLFLGTVGGLVLGQYADSILDSRGNGFAEVVHGLQPQAVDAQATRGLIGQGTRLDDGQRVGPGNEIAVPFIAPYASRVVPPRRHFLASACSRIDFVKELDHLWERLGVTLPADRVQPIGSFLREAFDNARRHGSTSLDRTDIRPVPSTRFMLVRRYNTIAPRELERASSVPGLESYFGEMARTSTWDDVTSLRLQRGANLLELSVMDAGVGISASLTGSVKVYEGDMVDEQDKLRLAMELDGTRYGRESGNGLGFPAMLDAAQKLKGVLLIRSGRIAGHRHFLTGGDDESLEISGTVQPLGVGTSVSLLVVVPLNLAVSSDQLTFAFDPDAERQPQRHRV